MLSNLLPYNNELYLVHRKISSFHFMNKDKTLNLEALNFCRENLGCEGIINDQSYIYFVDIIKDAIIEEEQNPILLDENKPG